MSGPDPITPLYQYGVTTGAAMISVGLFIWTKVEATLSRRVAEETHNATARTLEVMSKLADHMISLESSLLQLIRDQQASHQRIVETQAVIVTQLSTLTSSTTRLMEGLIDILKDA